MLAIYCQLFCPLASSPPPGAAEAGGPSAGVAGRHSRAAVHPAPSTRVGCAAWCPPAEARQRLHVSANEAGRRRSACIFGGSAADHRLLRPRWSCVGIFFHAAVRRRDPRQTCLSVGAVAEVGPLPRGAHCRRAATAAAPSVLARPLARPPDLFPPHLPCPVPRPASPSSGHQLPSFSCPLSLPCFINPTHADGDGPLRRVPPRVPPAATAPPPPPPHVRPAPPSRGGRRGRRRRCRHGRCRRQY